MRSWASIAAVLSMVATGAVFALSPPPPPSVTFESVPRVRVDPGSTVDWAFTLTSTVDYPLSDLTVGGYMATSREALVGYTFVPLTAACGAPYLSVAGQFVFPTSGTIEPRASLTCSYRIERAADAVHDLLLRLCAPRDIFCQWPVAIGSLPQMRIRVEQPYTVPEGARTALVRLHVDNLSDWTIPRRDVATSCHEFAGGQAPPSPFLVNTDIEGGCATGQPASCYNFGGQIYFSYGFRFGPFAPGESKSCLLQLQFHGTASDRLQAQVFFTDFRAIRDDGAVGVASLGEFGGIQPLGISVTPPANAAPVLVPVGRSAWLFLVAIMLGAGAVAMRRSTGTAQRGKEQ